MRTPALTLAAEIFLASRRGFMAIGAIFVGAAVFGLLPLASLKPGGLLNELMSLPMGLSIALLFALLNYTEQHPRSGTTGFPHRLFTLPVSTFTLVTGPMICGVLAISALYGAWVLLVLRPMGREFLLAWPALVLACGMVCYHCILWSLAGHRMARMIVLSLGGTTLVGISLLPMIFPESTTQPRIALIFIALAAAAYLVALASVHRQRHAGGVRTSAGQVLQRAIELIPSSKVPFRSPLHALFWLEFRRSGLILPFATGVVLVCFIVMALLSYPMPSEVAAMAFIWAAPLPLILSAFVGKSFSSESTIPSFIASRPASEGDLLFAKLRAAAASTLFSWLLVILLVPLWLMLCDTTMLGEWWRDSHEFLGSRIFAILPLVFLGGILLTWKLLIGSTPTGLLGRPRLYIVHSVLSLAMLTAAAITFPWLIDQFAAGRFRLTFLKDNSGTVVVLCILLLIKFSLGLYLWRRGLMARLLRPGHAQLYFAIWVVSTGIFVSCAYILFSAERIATLWPNLRWVVALAMLCCFPLARIPLGAISLSANRHR